MPAIIDKAKAGYDDARTAAVNARQEFNRVRSEAIDAEADLSPGSDAFAKLDAADRTRAEADERAASLEQHYMRIVEIEGGAREPLARDYDEERSTPLAPEARQGAEDSIRSLLASDAYKGSAEALRAGGPGIGGRRNIGEAASRDTAKALVTSGSGSAGSLIQPDRKPYVEFPTSRLRLQELITVGGTDSDTVDFVRLVTRPTGAGVVIDTTSVTPGAEDGLKPQGTVAFELDDAKVRTIAELVPVHRNTFADAAQFDTILRRLLAYDIQRALEKQIYDGTGIAPNFQGLTNTPGINSIAYDATHNILQQLRRGITAIRIDGEEPDWIALNPLDGERIAFLRTNEGGANTGSYLAGTPFGPASTTLWGLPLVETSQVTEGLPMIGTRSAATLHVRDGVQVLVSDSHKDWFQRNVLAVLAEMRAAFTVERPSGFAVVDIAA